MALSVSSFKLIGLLAVSILLALAVLAGRYALSDFYYLRSKSAYQNNVSQLTYSYELDSMIEDIDYSLKLRQGAANSLDFKGNLLYQSWWLSPDGQYFENSELLQNAVKLHGQALLLRRNWAFSMARLSLIYAQQAELGQSFDHWFSETHRLGLFETKIARSLMIIGLSNWRSLTNDQRSLTLDFIAVSLEQKVNSASMMIATLEAYNMHATVCAELPDTPRMLKVCRDV